MWSLIFATRRQNSSLVFFYGPYHSKFCLNNNIGYRYIHEGVVGKLYMLSTQYFLSIKIVTSSNYLPKKKLDWMLGKYATDVICKSFLKWNLTKLASVSQPGLQLG